MIKGLAEHLGKTLSNFHKNLTIDSQAIEEMLDGLGKDLEIADVPVHLIQQMQKTLRKQLLSEDFEKVAYKHSLVKKWVYQELVNLFSPKKNVFKPKRGRSQVIMFVGIQGAGKTTTIAKYAHFYQKRRWKCGIVCADTFRAGAFDQLRMNSTRINVPHYGSFTEPDPIIVAQEGTKLFRDERYELILIDTSGRHRQEESLFEEMIEMKDVVKPDHIIFVMDGTIGQSAYDQAKSFRIAMMNNNNTTTTLSVIITKLDDQNNRGGGALAAVCATDSPISFIGTGERFSDFELFDAEIMTSRLLGLKNNSSSITRKILEERMSIINSSTTKTKKEQKKMEKRMMEGTFTLRDLYDQMSSLLKLGIPINDLGEYFFGNKLFNSMTKNILNIQKKKNKQQQQQQTEEEEEQSIIFEVYLKRSLIIMDSMTSEELDDPNFSHFAMNEMRIRRLALGSGCCVKEVKELFLRYRDFKKMFGTKKKKKKKGNNIMRMIMDRMNLGGGGSGGRNNMNLERMMQMYTQVKKMGGFGRNIRRKK